MGCSSKSAEFYSASIKCFKDKKILITGGVGFIGSNLAIRLNNAGAIVTIVDSLIPEYGGNLRNIHEIKNSVVVNISDVRDKYSLEHLISDKEILFNLAGQTSHMDSMSDPFKDLDINCKSQLSILDACIKFNKDIRVIFASTRQVYGKPIYLPVSENHPLHPVDVNGINKIAGENYHILYNEVYGLKTSVLRLTNTYGPRMRIKDARQTFLGIWIRNLIKGLPISVWGGAQLRDFNYVEDVVDAMLKISVCDNSFGKILNLGSEEIISLELLAKKIISIYGAGEYISLKFPEERKKIDVGDYYSDFSRIRQLINWEPSVNLDKGLMETIEFYKKEIKYYE
jgi:nucleoside-diphosphate-sugar epimerase